MERVKMVQVAFVVQVVRHVFHPGIEACADSDEEQHDRAGFHHLGGSKWIMQGCGIVWHYYHQRHTTDTRGWHPPEAPSGQGH